MTLTSPHLVELGPDDDLFASWCEVWAAGLVGFTDLQVQLAQPERANQAGTLVLHEHRGRRLGARMKVAVLRELATALPAVRRISTCNSDSNEPMVSVNEALGFRPAGHLSTWSRCL